MANWDKKTKAIEKVSKIVNKEKDITVLHGLYMFIKKEKYKVNQIKNIIYEKDELENKLDEIGSNIFKNWDDKKIDILQDKESCKNKKFLEYKKNLDISSEEIKDRYKDLVEELIEDVKKEDWELRIEKAIKRGIEKGAGYVILDSLVKYNKKIDEIWDVYTTIKKEKNEDLEIEGSELKEKLNHSLNILNEEYYGNKGYV